MDDALKIAKQRNKNLLENISILPITLDHQETITLKVNKELQKKERLVNEEKLMLQEAQRRAETRRKPEINELILPERSEKFRQTLHAQLITMPYLTRVLVSEKNKQFILERSKENELKWSQPISAKKKAIEYTCKATIAEGFDLDPEVHWGKTKATIRDLLLPKANKLLQLASVQRLLAEAKLKGQFVRLSVRTKVILYG